ncbi:redoxin domain-containing protein [Lignipirellula cremea]|uniref:Thiol-disulfide oxidoreductase ResA n=1 Tax=Lignipirellula cremea TaxID=2528010 RepID=A0A518DS07_9BACT|nr:redoxin domain-containing protein [Lignipirellula cremea]QDU94625.1 Thiol-disulfide oxidoreductase ResA [Lignipirellula cremea]
MKFFVAWMMVLALATVGNASEEPEESPVGRTIDNFELQDYRGKAVKLDDFRDSKAVVVIFLGTECPLAKLYAPRLCALAAEYESQGVAFLGINANVQDSITEVGAYARIHEIKFPLLKDSGNRVADAMGAIRTPEAFLLDGQRRVRYWGRIDDQYGVGYARDNPQRQDLKEAIDQLLAGKPITLPEAEATGCHIGRIRQPDPNAKVTYSQQISRLLQKRCVECHRPGEIAPFALTDYEEVVGWAETIAETVEENRMPPWHASPKHGDFINDRRLSKEEKQLIYDWVAAGAPQGDPTQLPEPLEYTTGWQLPREPDYVVAMRPAPYSVPAEGKIRYQYFTVNPGFTEDKWVTAAEVAPGNRAVVHHILVFVKTPSTRLSEEGGFLAAYVPGLREKPYLPGMAKKIPAGAQLYFQVHYTPIGSPQQDLSKIALVFCKPEEVEYEVKTASVSTRNILIPPEDGNYVAEATSGSLGEDALLLSYMPHMHLRGKSFRYETRPREGDSQILLDVPEYDFNWQTSYRLREPMTLQAGTQIYCQASYDNSKRNLSNPDPQATVRWGAQTDDEMLFGYFDYAIKVPGPETNKATPEMLRYARSIIMQLDRNRDGRVSRKEVPRQHMSTFERLDVNRDNQLTLEEMLTP